MSLSVECARVLVRHIYVVVCCLCRVLCARALVSDPPYLRCACLVCHRFRWLPRVVYAALFGCWCATCHLCCARCVSPCAGCCCLYALCTAVSTDFRRCRLLLCALCAYVVSAIDMRYSLLFCASVRTEYIWASLVIHFTDAYCLCVSCSLLVLCV